MDKSEEYVGPLIGQHIFVVAVAAIMFLPVKGTSGKALMFATSELIRKRC